MQRLMWLAGVVFVGLAATFAEAQDAAKPAKPGKPQAKATNALFRLPDSIALSDEQKTRIETIRKEYEPKLEAVQAKGDVLTPEQKEIQKTFKAEAKASGKKGKELNDELNGKLKLTDEQKKTLAEVKQEASALHKEIRGKVVEVLTADQKKMLEESQKKPAKKGASA